MDMSVGEITESSLTVVDDLTAIFNQSNLPSTHESLRTKTGFLVQGDLLKDYAPTPPKSRPRHSWIYKDRNSDEVRGEAITNKRTGKSYWLCRFCYNKPQCVLHLEPAKPTNLAQHHLEKHGFHLDGIKKAILAMTEKRKAEGDVLEAIKRQKAAEDAPFDKDDWKAVFLEYVVSSDCSLRTSASEQLQTLASYRAPLIKPFFPKSHQLTHNWIVASYCRNKSLVASSLAVAKSRITLSFDGWKSDNELDLLGIIAHYVDDKLQPKTVLLALRNTHGLHTAEEMQYHLLAVSREYCISSKLSQAMP